MKRRDFISNIIKGIILIPLIKVLPTKANSMFATGLKIATPSDAQAITDYWNDNLPAIEAELGMTLKPMEVSWLNRNFEKGFIAWEENNVMVSSIVYDGEAIVDFCWSSGVSFLKAGLIYFAEYAKTKGITNIKGTVKTGSSFARFLELYNIPGEDQGNFSTFGDTPDNFITKLS